MTNDELAELNYAHLQIIALEDRCELLENTLRFMWELCAILIKTKK
jgi:hypothetical protein